MKRNLPFETKRTYKLQGNALDSRLGEVVTVKKWIKEQIAKTLTKLGSLTFGLKTVIFLLENYDRTWKIPKSKSINKILDKIDKILADGKISTSEIADSLKDVLNGLK